MGLELVKQTVAKVSKTIATTKYPNIVYPQCVTIDSDIPVGVRRKIHLGTSTGGDFEAGLITTNVNAIPVVEVEFNAQENVLVDWVQKVQYNQLEIEQAQTLGIALDAQKLLELDRFANNGLQQIAFIGSTKEKDLTGLLNAKAVQAINAGTGKVKVNKNVSEMSFNEILEFFKGILLTSLEKTNGIQAPDTILLDSNDLAALAFVNKENTDMTALDALNKALNGATGHNVTIRAVPMGFAKKITAGKTRAVIYSNNSQDVVFDVPMAPQTLTPYQTNALEYETGIRMVFGGVVFKNPESAIYVDY